MICFVFNKIRVFIMKITGKINRVVHYKYSSSRVNKELLSLFKELRTSYKSQLNAFESIIIPNFAKQCGALDSSNNNKECYMNGVKIISSNIYLDNYDTQNGLTIFIKEYNSTLIKNAI